MLRRLSAEESSSSMLGGATEAPALMQYQTLSF